MSKFLHVTNQLNDGLTVEFCCGEKEYTLGYEETVIIELREDACMYLDIVRKPKSGHPDLDRLLAIEEKQGQ